MLLNICPINKKKKNTSFAPGIRHDSLLLHNLKNRKKLDTRGMRGNCASLLDYKCCHCVAFLWLCQMTNL